MHATALHVHAFSIAVAFNYYTHMQYDQLLYDIIIKMFIPFSIPR